MNIFLIRKRLIYCSNSFSFSSFIPIQTQLKTFHIRFTLKTSHPEDFSHAHFFLKWNVITHFPNNFFFTDFSYPIFRNTFFSKFYILSKIFLIQILLNFDSLLIFAYKKLNFFCFILLLLFESFLKKNLLSSCFLFCEESS